MRCIVLRTVKYGDSRLIVDTLTRDRGRVSVVWRMPRSGRGKVGRHVFQPLTICDIECEAKHLGALPVVRDGHIAVPYVSLNTDMVKVSVAFFLAEFLVQVSEAGQADAYFYDFVETSLRWYDLAESMTANFHLMFLVRASRYLGFFPNMETFAPGCYFDMRGAEFTASAPLHRDFLMPAEAEKIGLLTRITPDNMHRFRFSREERTRAIEIMLQFYGLHVPGFREMKSWEVLREVFGEKDPSRPPR